jgi:hypothetical protein
MKYIIDRFEGKHAILEDDDMNTVPVCRSLIDDGAKEGSCLIFDGRRYVLNADETTSDTVRIKSKFDRLKK